MNLVYHHKARATVGHKQQWKFTVKRSKRYRLVLIRIDPPSVRRDMKHHKYAFAFDATAIAPTRRKPTPTPCQCLCSETLLWKRWCAILGGSCDAWRNGAAMLCFALTPVFVNTLFLTYDSWWQEKRSGLKSRPFFPFIFKYWRIWSYI